MCTGPAETCETHVAWLISPHDEAATRWWMEHVVLATQRVWTAHPGDQLVLLEAAKQAIPGGSR